MAKNTIKSIISNNNIRAALAARIVELEALLAPPVKKEKAEEPLRRLDRTMEEEKEAALERGKIRAEAYASAQMEKVVAAARAAAMEKEEEKALRRRLAQLEKKAEARAAKAEARKEKVAEEIRHLEAVKSNLEAWLASKEQIEAGPDPAIEEDRKNKLDDERKKREEQKRMLEEEEKKKAAARAAKHEARAKARAVRAEARAQGSASDEKISKVDDKGTVTTMEEGKVTITATYEELTAEAKLEGEGKGEEKAVRRAAIISRLSAGREGSISSLIENIFEAESFEDAVEEYKEGFALLASAGRDALNDVSEALFGEPQMSRKLDAKRLAFKGRAAFGLTPTFKYTPKEEGSNSHFHYTWETSYEGLIQALTVAGYLGFQDPSSIRFPMLMPQTEAGQKPVNELPENVITTLYESGYISLKCRHLIRRDVYSWVQETMFSTAQDMRAYSGKLFIPIQAGTAGEYKVSIKEMKTPAGISEGRDGSGRIHPQHELYERLGVDTNGSVPALQIVGFSKEGHFFKGIVEPSHLCKEGKIEFDVAQVKGKRKAEVKAAKKAADEAGQELDIELSAFVGVLSESDAQDNDWSFQMLERIERNEDTETIIKGLQTRYWAQLPDIEELARGSRDPLVPIIIDLLPKINEGRKAIGQPEIHFLDIKEIRSSVEETLGKRFWSPYTGAGMIGEGRMVVMCSEVPRGSCWTFVPKKHRLEGFMPQVAVTRYPVLLTQGLAVLQVEAAPEWKLVNGRLPKDVIYLNPVDLTELMQGDDDGDRVVVNFEEEIIHLYENRRQILDDAEPLHIEAQRQADSWKASVPADDFKAISEIVTNGGQGPTGMVTIAMSVLFNAHYGLDETLVLNGVESTFGHAVAYLALCTQTCIDYEKHSMRMPNLLEGINPVNWKSEKSAVQYTGVMEEALLTPGYFRSAIDEIANCRGSITASGWWQGKSSDSHPNILQGTVEKKKITDLLGFRKSLRKVLPMRGSKHSLLHTNMWHFMLNFEKWIDEQWAPHCTSELSVVDLLELIVGEDWAKTRILTNFQNYKGAVVDGIGNPFYYYNHMLEALGKGQLSLEERAEKSAEITLSLTSDIQALNEEPRGYEYYLNALRNYSFLAQNAGHDGLKMLATKRVAMLLSIPENPLAKRLGLKWETGDCDFLTAKTQLLVKKLEAEWAKGNDPCDVAFDWMYGLNGQTIPWLHKAEKGKHLHQCEICRKKMERVALMLKRGKKRVEEAGEVKFVNQNQSEAASSLVKTYKANSRRRNLKNVIEALTKQTPEERETNIMKFVNPNERNILLSHFTPRHPQPPKQRESVEGKKSEMPSEPVKNNSQAEIVVKSSASESSGFYIGAGTGKHRPSTLHKGIDGNPNCLRVDSLYREWLNERYSSQKGPAYRELMSLYQHSTETNAMVLLCDCPVESHQSYCRGEVIATALRLIHMPKR